MNKAAWKEIGKNSRNHAMNEMSFNKQTLTLNQDDAPTARHHTPAAVYFHEIAIPVLGT